MHPHKWDMSFLYRLQEDQTISRFASVAVLAIKNANDCGDHPEQEPFENSKKGARAAHLK
jgi:hypothetical protein